LKLTINIFFLLIISNLLIAQEQINVPVVWESPYLVIIDGVERTIPLIKNQSFQANTPMVRWTKKLNSKLKYEIQLLSFETDPATQVDRDYLNQENIEVSETLDIDFAIKNAGKDKYAVAVFMPFIQKGNQLSRITNVNFELKDLGAQASIPAKDFVAKSLLNSGEWYKVKLREDGVYKIDKAFLEACGFSTSNLKSDHIHVYGNGDGMLPTDNDAPRTDDLANNAIQVFDGGDGNFDDGDYLIFYGRSPHQWEVINNLYRRKTNVYSDDAYYFITISSSVSPKRIQSQNSSPGIANQQANEMDFVQHHEVDSYNLMKGGQRWYGELFDTELSRSFSFYVPSIVKTNTLNIAYTFASNSRDSANKYSISLNDSELLNETMNSAGADFLRRGGNLLTTPNSDNLNIGFTVSRVAPDVLTYLDYLTIQGRRALSFYGDQMLFRDFTSLGFGNLTRFTLTNAGLATVWETTDWQNPKLVQGTMTGSTFQFTLETDSLREFIAFKNSGFKLPTRVGKVSPQNLHGLAQADYLIISPPQFMEQANRLADLHRGKGLDVHVVAPDRIYNEFSSGMQDATAFRSFVKMFYDRGNANGTKLPKYLLLFGDGVFDPKGRVSTENYILTYQVVQSETHISALVTDDYFGFLDDNEGFNTTDMLDVGIGRLLVSSTQIAKEQVDKIQHYMKNGSEFFTSPGDCDCLTANTKSTFGDWRTKYVQIADDEQNEGRFVTEDTEPQVSIVDGYRREMNVDKIYLDAYEQISTAGGQRYPSVNEAINDRIRRGALVVNYVGHGGEVGVAEERVITVPQIQAWKNSNAFPLIVSATCEFTKFDDPDRVSAGEWASLNKNGGAIALMTTTRSVFISVNTAVMKSFFREIFTRNEDSLALTFGEIIQRTKNGTSNFSENSRCFTLIGDPALRLAMPQYKMVLDSTRREGSNGQNDTIRALDKITVVGHIEDLFGNSLTNFNGIASPTLYDKPKTFYTLGQDPESSVIPFELQKNALYKGQATVKDGKFSMTFIVPKDIDYKIGNGKLSMYGHNFSTDAMGYDEGVVVGGVNPNGIVDDRGPDIELYMNDYTFVNGGLTNERPTFIARLFDDNGINAVGNGIGHDITAILDDKTGDPFVLNEYYLSDLDTYQSGEVRYVLPQIEPGLHKITFKVWDVNNNSSESILEFEVKGQEQPALSHVLNYPNPFTTSTKFYFEHNQINTALETQIQIFTISGKIVKTINKLVNTNGFRSEGIGWDGKDEFGDQLAKGVYVYRLSIRTDTGEMADEWEKLVILK
jgi:hypothetical protein